MYEYINDLLEFLDTSPTPVQAAEAAIQRLKQSGFAQLEETDKWMLNSGGKYFVLRSTSVIAWVIGSDPLTDTGFNLAAAHLDSPCLKLKPESIKTERNVTRIAVEVYGGPILSTWTDRPLGIAGRVAVRKGEQVSLHSLVLNEAVAVIPNVAIHLNREVNKGFEYNKQTHLQAILQTGETAGNPLLEAITKRIDAKPEQIVDMDLFFYPYELTRIVGMDDSLIVGRGLDNQAMSHAVLSALRQAQKPVSTCVAALYDHEEIGSRTAQGAGSSFLEELLTRIGITLGLNHEEQIIALRRSFLVSADMAHAFHPSYPEKYDPTCAPVMNGGPVIKYNAGHSYASTAESSQRFAALCVAADVPCQKFVMRSDLICGSTVGPILSANLGIPAVDVGNPLWAMHSACETAGVKDHEAMIKALIQFYK